MSGSFYRLDFLTSYIADSADSGDSGKNLTCKVTLPMDWRSLPSLSALRAFAALAETGSFTRAGAALNVSHAAISQQVRALEERLGVALLPRDGRRGVLTPAGERLAAALERRLRRHRPRRRRADRRRRAPAAAGHARPRPSPAAG